MPDAPLPEPTSLLTRDERDGVAVLTLNRPRAGNSLSRELIAALDRAFDALADDRSVRSVVLAGAGHIFCSGHDLKEFQAHRGDAAFFRTVAAECSAMMQKIPALPQPVIARVHGVATAAGCQLVAAADLAIASSAARFATPGVNIGLWCHTPQVPLSRTVAPKHALHMLLSGKLFDAEHAARIGLVNEVVAPEDLDQAVDAPAREIADKSGYSMALGKRSFYRQLDLDLPDAYELAGKLVAENMLAHDAGEGIDAFLEKRPPVWAHR